MQDESWMGLYRLFKGLGLPRPSVPVSLPGKDIELTMGWPTLEIALTIGGPEEEAARKFERAGWQVVVIPLQSLEASAALLSFLDSLAKKRIIAESEQSAKMDVSKTEQKLMAAILDVGLPTPNRNVEFKDATGNLVTVPDFAWEDVKLAVYMDGHWYHGGKDLDDNLKAAVSDDDTLSKEIQDRAKTTAARDAAKRRAITKIGWKVMAVSDTEIDAGNAAVIAEEIKETYEGLLAERADAP